MIWMASCGPWAQTSGGKRSNSAIMKSEDLSGQRVCAGLFDKVNKMSLTLDEFVEIVADSTITLRPDKEYRVTGLENVIYPSRLYDHLTARMKEN